MLKIIFYSFKSHSSTPLGLRISFNVDIPLHTGLSCCCSPVLCPYVHKATLGNSIFLHPFMTEIFILLYPDGSAAVLTGNFSETCELV